MGHKINISDSENEFVNSTHEIDGLVDFDEDSQTSSDKTTNIEENENDYPMKTIKVEKGFYTTFELKRKHDKDLLILDSDFQRKAVWSLHQKRELIESILMGLPLPIFYFNEDKKGRLIVIDGRQRLTALFEFISPRLPQNGDNGFKLEKLKILTDFKGMSFVDLEPILQAKIEDYQIMAHVIQPPTPDRIKFDIFDRVNRAGTQLNKQEIRNALYQGNATKLLIDLSKNDSFILATEEVFKKDKRMKDRYLLLRFISFYLYFNEKIMDNNEIYEYSGDIDELLGLSMEYLNNLNLEEIDNIYTVAENSLKQVAFYLGDNAFRLTEIDKNGKLKRYPININIFENVMYAMTMIPFCDNNLKSIVKLKFNEMKDSHIFRDSINNHRDSLPKVQIRYDIIMMIIGEIYDN